MKDREFIRKYEFVFESDRPSLPRSGYYFKQCHPKIKGQKNMKLWMAQVVITTPSVLITSDSKELSAIKWDIVVVDEAQQMKNHAARLTKVLSDRQQFNFNHKILLTGTPIQNSMDELWTLLNFVAPDQFGNLDDFLDKYGAANMKSKERTEKLHNEIRPYILRRLKEDVEKPVPPKEETLIEVELTVLQKKYYRAIYERNIRFLYQNRKTSNGPSLRNIFMELRKCCNHPFLLQGVEQLVRKKEAKKKLISEEGDLLVNASGKLVLLDKLLPRLKRDGHRVLIFSQFVIMLNILEDYLNARSFKTERIDGSITGLKRQNAIDRFQEKGDGKEKPFVMLLSTKAGGVGINLTAADTCIMFDSDFNPQNDIQAQARCHRIGQTKSVKVYRLLSRKTYEMCMFRMSSLKLGLDQAVLYGVEKKSVRAD